jgi:hypothetical protein
MNGIVDEMWGIEPGMGQKDREDGLGVVCFP